MRLLLPSRRALDHLANNVELILGYATQNLRPGLKKALFVSHDFPNIHRGGAQLYARDLAGAINRLGSDWRVDVMYPVFRSYFEKSSIRHSFVFDLNVYEVVKDRNYYINPRSTRHPLVEDLVSDFFRTHRYEVVHVHGLGELSLSPLLAAQAAGIPTLATLHDFWFMCAEWFMSNSLGLCTGPESVSKCAECVVREHTNLPTQPSVAGASEFIRDRMEESHAAFSSLTKAYAPSQYVADFFRRYGYEGVVSRPLGLNPVETVDVRNESRRNGVVFGYFGNLSERKGVRLAIDAFKSLPVGHGARLKIYGKSQSAQLTSLIKSETSRSKWITYHGSYSPDTLGSLLRGIDVVLVPSYWESFSIVVREAFQFGRPVIASRVGGIPEAFEDGVQSLLFDVGSVEDLRKKMMQLIKQPERIDSLATNVPVVRTIDDDAAYYVREYEAVLQRRSRTGNGLD